MTKTIALAAAKDFARNATNGIDLATAQSLDYNARLALASGTSLASVYAGVPEKWHGDVRATFTETFVTIIGKKVRAHEEHLRNFTNRYENATTLTAAREAIEKTITASGLRGLANVSAHGFEIRRGGGSWALAEVRVKLDTFGSDRVSSPVEGDTRYFRAVTVGVEVRTTSGASTVAEATVQAAAYRDAIELAAELELLLNNLRPIARENEY